MSKTRNQRRRKFLSRVALIALTLLLIANIVAVVRMWLTIEQMTSDRRDKQAAGPVYYAGAILPADFSEEAYEIALQRYDVEHGLVIPNYTSAEVEHHAER